MSLKRPFIYDIPQISCSPQPPHSSKLTFKRPDCLIAIRHFQWRQSCRNDTTALRTGTYWQCHVVLVPRNSISVEITSHDLEGPGHEACSVSLSKSILPSPFYVQEEELGGVQPSFHGRGMGSGILETTSAGTKCAQAKEKL